MQCVILAGGRGERLRPLTDNVPKPMLPVAGKPVLEHQIALLKQHRIRDVIICGHYLFDSIKKYFGNGSDFGVKIEYVNEEIPMGSGGAVKYAGKKIRDDFIVLSGDVMTNIGISDLARFHEEKGGIATLVLRKTEHPEDSDIVALDKNKKVVRIFFKNKTGKQGNLGNAGIFAFTKEILEKIPESPCNLERDVIAPAIGTANVYGYLTNDYIRDMGTFERYEKIRKDIERGLLS